MVQQVACGPEVTLDAPIQLLLPLPVEDWRQMSNQLMLPKYPPLPSSKAAASPKEAVRAEEIKAEYWRTRTDRQQLSW